MSQKYDSVIRKPSWLKINLQNSPRYAEVSQIVQQHSLNTICGSGKCPNMSECWSRGTATFMILGNICTRSCRFCATATGKPLPLEEAEPARVAESVRMMGLKHAVITSVTRDDLPDGGAKQWAITVERIKGENPNTTIELLIPDMKGVKEDIDTILASGADIVGHNIETVERLSPDVRSAAQYKTSLEVIEYISQCGVTAKSGIMVGLGEESIEVEQTLRDLRNVGCSIVTIGQYLQPSKAHLPVERYITPEEFDNYKSFALGLGFDYVASGPLVRSSYMAEEALSKGKCKISLRDLK